MTFFGSCIGALDITFFIIFQFSNLWFPKGWSSPSWPSCRISVPPAVSTLLLLLPIPIKLLDLQTFRTDIGNVPGFLILAKMCYYIVEDSLRVLIIFKNIFVFLCVCSSLSFSFFLSIYLSPAAGGLTNFSFLLARYLVPPVRSLIWIPISGPAILTPSYSI